MPEVKEEVECEDCDWLMTYGDMITLLLCLFILMNNSSKVDTAAYEQLRSALVEEFSGKNIPKPVDMMMSEFNEDLKGLPMGDKVVVGSDYKGVVLDIAAASFFSSGSAEIQEDALPFLNLISSTIKAERYNMFGFTVEGHTASTEETNEKYPTNWELSSARASAIARYLIATGIEPVRFKVIGYADMMPKMPNNDAFGDPIPTNQEQNRRIVIRAEPQIR